MHIDRRIALFSVAALALAMVSPVEARDGAQVAPIRAVETALAGRDGALPSHAAVRVAVAREFNLDSMARFILAGHAFTPAQLARFRDALADRLALDMIDQRRRDGRGTIVVVQTRALKAGEWIVETRVIASDKRQRAVAWRIGAGSGRARIVDVLGNGASLARSWRNRYIPNLRKVGLDGLIERMEARNRKMRNQAAPAGRD